MPTARTQAAPALRRQFALALLLTMAAGAAAAWAISGSSAAALKALVLPLLLGVLTGGTLGQHRRTTLGPANAVTLLRATLAASVAALLGEPGVEDQIEVVLAVSAVAFALDGLDGRVARATDSASPFGALLDMELDGLFILALCALAWQLDRAGAWVLASGGLRYAFIAAGWRWPWMNRPLFETRRRAWVCAIQVACLWACLVPWPIAGLSTGLAAVGLVALVYSFGVDTWWLFQHRNDP